MKQIILSVVIILTAMSSIAQMDVPFEGGSIKATVTEQVGITDITIRYWRPGVKGREGKIWGNVVAYGFNALNFISNKNTSPWRAGANEATVISFEHDVKVEGRDLKAGSYALFMAMSADSAMLIFSKQTEAWGSFFYRPEDDVLRLNVKSSVLDQPVEWLKYEFIGHREKSCVIAMQWEKLSVAFTVEVDVDNIVLNRVREQMMGMKGFLGGNLIQASRYFFGKNINMEEALQWSQRAVTGQPLAQTGYDAFRTLAIGYEKLSRLLQADSVMNQAMTIASVSQYMGYGRTLITQKRFDRALEIMLAAQAKFGDIYSVNNGLSFAYSAKADYVKALQYANKALAQAPGQRAKTVVNANIEKLKAGKDIN